MDVIARLPGCDGQAAGAAYAKTQVKIGGRSRIAHRIVKSESIQTCGYVFHDTNGGNHGAQIEDLPCYFFSEICMVTHQLDCFGKDSSKKLY